MKYTLIIDSINWDDDYNNSAITCINYSVFKKGFMGGLKPVQKNWCLIFKHDKSGEIDINTFTIQDDNIHSRPFEAPIAWQVLILAKDFIAKSGRNDNEAIFQRAIRKFYDKYFSDEGNRAPDKDSPPLDAQKEPKRLELIKTIFRDVSEYNRFLVSKKKIMVANDDSIASLEKIDGKFVYELAVLNGDKCVSDCVTPFKPNESNLIKFNEGCVEIARLLQIYVENGDLNQEPNVPVFESLNNEGCELNNSSSSSNIKKEPAKYFPNINDSKRVKGYDIKDYLIVLLTDIKSNDRVGYTHLLVVFEKTEKNIPLLVVSSEVSTQGIPDFQPNILGLFTGNGHLNLGNSFDWKDLDKFEIKALDVVRKHIGI